jgi:hypothetical protein
VIQFSRTSCDAELTVARRPRAAKPSGDHIPLGGFVLRLRDRGGMSDFCVIKRSTKTQPSLRDLRALITSSSKSVVSSGSSAGVLAGPSAPAHRLTGEGEPRRAWRTRTLSTTSVLSHRAIAKPVTLQKPCQSAIGVAGLCHSVAGGPAIHEPLSAKTVAGYAQKPAVI